MGKNEDHANLIIGFAEATQKSQTLSNSQKDLLIREYIRNYENKIEVEQKKESIKVVFEEKKYPWWAWIILTAFFLISPITGLMYVQNNITIDLKPMMSTGVGVLFFVLIGFSITSFLGFIKKW